MDIRKWYPPQSSAAQDVLGLCRLAVYPCIAGESASSLGGDDSQQLLPGVVTPIGIAGAPDSKEATTATVAKSPDAESSTPTRAFCNYTGKSGSAELQNLDMERLAGSKKDSEATSADSGDFSSSNHNASSSGAVTAF